MRIVEPSVEIITPIDGEATLKHIELCGRVCYKSEDKITEDSAERFVRSIIRRGHESVLEHYDITFRFICDRGVSHELVRHRIASYCLSGDTVIRSMSQKSWTLRELYEWQNDWQRMGRLKLMHIRSVDEETMTVVSNTIDKVTFMGVKPVYELTTESGRSIKCTEDHRILCKDGWKPLGEIVIGDYVCANGKELLKNPDWLRYYYLEQNHTRKETAEAIGCCESLVYRAFQEYGIFKPWSARPNRRPGYGKKGAMSEAGRRKIAEMHRGTNNPGYKVERRELGPTGGYDESRRRYNSERTACEFCGATGDVELHHINKIPFDNRRANIKMLCPRCHHLWHKPGAIGVFYDKVVKVEYVGAEDVYDMSMASDIHNFVANGIVVHNCQESSRYCNYGHTGEIAVIAPSELREGTVPYVLWKQACEAAETAYMHLIASGVKPETARSVLPTCTKTEVVCTMNLRELRHFLRLRTSKAAHPDMRLLALTLLATLKAKIPVVFDDIGEKGNII